MHILDHNKTLTMLNQFQKSDRRIYFNNIALYMHSMLMPDNNFKTASLPLLKTI